MYETLKEGGNEVPPNPAGTTSDTYSYPDSNIANLPSSEQEYAYATDTDFRGSSVGTKPGAKRPINNGVVYQTLEQPGQPSEDDVYNYPDNTNIAKPLAPSELEYTYAKDTDLPKANPNTKIGASQPGQPSDNFYSYPENTNIAKPPSSELEYTYAKDTDIPKVTADKKTVPEQPPTTGLYKLPGTNIPTELEYTYAKDTDIPRVTVDKKTVPEEPSTSNAVYHTLEQEPPPTAHLYKLPGTNIPTELEYTYAKDTDIPRVTVDKKTVPEEPTSNAVYHTLEQEPPPTAHLYKLPGTNIPTELEYTYAKDTDIPRITTNTKSAAMGDSAPTASDT